MALSYVLWIISIMAILVGGLGTASRNQLLLTRNLVAQAQADALADGAINLVLAELAVLAPGDVRPGKRTVRLPTGTARVTIADLGGRVDVNTAAPSLVRNIFRAAGADNEIANALSDQLLARRPRLKPDGGSDSANNKPWLVLDELAALPAMSPALYARLENLITTHGGHRGADPAIADPIVVLALAGLDRNAAEDYLAERGRKGRYAPLAAPDAGPIVGAGFQLRAEATGKDGGRALRIAVVKPPRADRREKGLRIVDWQSLRAD